MPPPINTSPPRPPKRPFGGPPPPPSRADRRVSSFWMRAHASLGSGADIAARCGRGLMRGVQKTCRRRRWRNRVGDAFTRIVPANHRHPCQAGAKPLRAFPCCVLFGHTGNRPVVEYCIFSQSVSTYRRHVFRCFVFSSFAASDSGCRRLLHHAGARPSQSTSYLSELLSTAVHKLTQFPIHLLSAHLVASSSSLLV
jgi:hypothetical protein